MDRLKDHPRWKELNLGVRKDGTVENHVVETYIAFPYAIRYPRQYGYERNDDGKFVAFTIDNGGTDIEVRLPYETVEFIAQLVADARAGKPITEDDDE